MSNRLKLLFSTPGSISKSQGIIVLLLLLHSCVDPVIPEFDYQGDVLFIDAYALTEKNLSSVKIQKSVVDDDISYLVKAVENATVRFINVSTGTVITCSEGADGVYFPPDDFAVETGEEWKLEVELENGKRYESETERVGRAIPINDIEASFSSELVFDDRFGEYIPGHAINIDWQDPAGEQNYYLWRYRSFEPLSVCLTCETGRYRNGACTQESNWRRYTNYLCKTDCWQIRYGDQFRLFDDQFVDGKLVTNRKVADIPFYRKVPILVEVQQLTLTESGYEYFKVIDDISNESGGLNAPPPAALIGNLYSPDNSEEVVLGQFTASGVVTKTIYIERDQVPGSPITPDDPLRLEQCPLPCPDSLIYFPCVEGEFRTTVRPEDWP